MDHVGLNASDLDCLYRTIEASLGVRKHYQYFLWTQGDLQALLPHDTLICAAGDLSDFSARLDAFTPAPFSTRKLELLGNPDNGLIPRLTRYWQAGGCEPVLLFDAYPDDRERCFLMREIRLMELVNCAAHGVIDCHSGCGVLFAFFGVRDGLCGKFRHGLELLVPHLYMAYQRTILAQSEPAAAEADECLVLSEREREILHWIRIGKTNQEIGQILNISPYTVKNHVQKILRKLNVSNRTQAVAKSTPRKMPSESITQ